MKNPYWSLLQASWKYGCNVRFRFVLVYVLYIFNNIVVALHPLLYAWFINALQTRGTDALKDTWMYVGGFIILRLLEWAFHGPARIMERQLAFRITRNFMEEIYGQVLHLPMKWHKDHHSGDTISRVRKAYEALREFFQSGFLYINSVCRFFFSFAAMLYFAPAFGFLALGLGVLTIWVIFKFDKPFVATLEEVNQKENTVSTSLFDSLSNIMTVISLRLEKRMIANTISKLKRVYPSLKKNIRWNELKWFTGQMLIGIIFGITILGYVYQNYIPGGVFYIGGLVALLSYVNNFTSVFNDVAFQYTRLLELNTNFEMADNIINTYKTLPKRSTGNTLGNWNSIEVVDLNYSYPVIKGTPHTGAINNINLHLEKGKKIALIGKSGGGKSTILSLLRGLDLPEDKAKIVLDGHNELNFSSLFNTVTLFPQDPEIFENTIRYNITLGLPFTEQQVRWASEVAQFIEVANNLPHGLDTDIQEKGVNLSGGQKQRLALARGILCALSNDLLLLDEPTSSIDPRTELLFYQQFFQAFPDKVIVSTLHRLHLLPNFDYIYIIENGSIAAHGSFQDLYEKNEIFMDLWRHQHELHSEILIKA